jgi:muramidase (phage lysozyme)
MKKIIAFAMLLVGGAAWAGRRLYGPANEVLAMPGPTPEQQQSQQLQDEIQQQNEAAAMPVNRFENNLRAMRETIARAEGTAGQPDPYAVCYGYRFVIADFSNHPAVIGAWDGERLSDAHCLGAGQAVGCVSTAAGKYQFIKKTWLELQARLSLQDFGPESQDAACNELLRRCGAIDKLQAGDFQGAVYAARKIWASLAGAGYGQGEKSVQWLTARFTENGGVLA